MAIKLGAEVGQLHVVNGVRQERTACLGTFEQPASLFRRRDQGRLFVVIELTGDALDRDALYEDLTRMVGTTYYNTPGSITAGLRAALRAPVHCPGWPGAGPRRPAGRGANLSR